MKTLIENSIRFERFNKSPNLKTVFNIVSEDEKNSRYYRSVSKHYSGLNNVMFTFDEDGVLKTDTISFFAIGTDDEIKNSLISEINNKLNQ